MKLLVVIILLAIFLIAECTQFSSTSSQSSTTVTTIGDIVKSPENYENKTVTVSGVFGYYGLYSRNDIWRLQDKEDYNLEIRKCGENGMTLIPGKGYNATGIIKNYQICECEEISGNQSYEVPSGKYTSEDCENNGYQCKNDSFETIYYLECTEPMTEIS